MKPVESIIKLLFLAAVFGCGYFYAENTRRAAWLANADHASLIIGRASAYIVFYDSLHTVPYKLAAPVYAQIPGFTDSLKRLYHDGEVVPLRVRKE